MKFNFKLFLKTFYLSFFKSDGTPGRITPKRFFVLLFIFLLYPFWHFSIRLAYGLDKLFYPEHQDQDINQPIFIVGNFRSGTTLLHRLLAKDIRFTGMTSWEIYVAPSIVQRKLIRWFMRVNRAIGNPAQKVINAFEKALKNYSYMHKTGLNEIEEDGQINLHLWTSYHLLAFFPFPELIRDFIYYDDMVSEEQKEQEMNYYQEVVQRHVYASGGKRYISKNPTYSPKVRTLHEKFPDAKFINLVRSPLRVVPSAVSMFANHWRTYGEPEVEYPPTGPEVIMEQAKYWYLHPHEYLRTLPEDQYILVKYRDLVADPEGTVRGIYRQFGMDLTPEYEALLHAESEKAKQYKSKHTYSMKDMGINREKVKKTFAPAIRELDLEKENTG
jgi:omega-hydroxy-beta-dihydromenaquinone-9 sulfotransferase